MPFFKDSYETTSGSVSNTKSLNIALQTYFIKEEGKYISLNIDDTGETHPIFITGYYSSESEIPLFTHPITIKKSNGQNYLVTDLRFFIRKNTDYTDLDQSSNISQRIEKDVKNWTEYNFAKTRAILNLAWVNGGENEIRNSLPFAGIIFASWISEAIGKAYALDYNDQLKIAVLASFYYQSLFNDENQFDENTRQKMAIHTIKATRSDSGYVNAVFDKIEAIDNINSFCEYVKSVTENIRLKNFNYAMLLTIIRNSWYGINSKEIIAVCIEHPPTWIAMVHAALTERTYKSSMIYRIAERFGKHGAADEFSRSFITIIQSRMKEANSRIGYESRPALEDFI